MASTALRRDFEKTEARPVFKLDQIRPTPLAVGVAYICAQQKEFIFALKCDDDVDKAIAEQIYSVIKQRDDAEQHVAVELYFEDRKHLLGTLEQCSNARLGVVEVILYQSAGVWRGLKASFSADARYVSKQKFEVRWAKRPPAKALVNAAASSASCLDCCVIL
jgi:hypothetical protein